MASVIKDICDHCEREFHPTSDKRYVTMAECGKELCSNCYLLFLEGIEIGRNQTEAINNYTTKHISRIIKLFSELSDERVKIILGNEGFRMIEEARKELEVIKSVSENVEKQKEFIKNNPNNKMSFIKE